MNNYNEFIERYYSSANSTKLDDIMRFLKHLTRITENIPIEEALKKEQIVCELFYLQKVGNNISRSHYQKIKQYLINIFDYIGINPIVPTREEVIASQDTISYFCGIDHLLSFIDRVGASTLVGYNPTTDLVRIKAICILAWIGFASEEIASCETSRLLAIGDSGYKIISNRGTFEIYGHAFSALFYLTELECYKGLPSGKINVLKGDKKYLFRPVDSTLGGKLEGSHIIQTLKRFNACIPRSLKTTIVLRNLYKNSLFLEIYNDKSKMPLLDKITTITGCTGNYAYSYRDQYEDFVKTIEKNKV